MDTKWREISREFHVRRKPIFVHSSYTLSTLLRQSVMWAPGRIGSLAERLPLLGCHHSLLKKTHSRVLSWPENLWAGGHSRAQGLSVCAVDKVFTDTIQFCKLWNVRDLGRHWLTASATWRHRGCGQALTLPPQEPSPGVHCVAPAVGSTGLTHRSHGAPPFPARLEQGTRRKQPSLMQKAEHLLAGILCTAHPRLCFHSKELTFSLINLHFVPGTGISHWSACKILLLSGNYTDIYVIVKCTY